MKTLNKQKKTEDFGSISHQTTTLVLFIQRDSATRFVPTIFFSETIAFKKPRNCPTLFYNLLFQTNSRDVKTIFQEKNRLKINLGLAYKT